MKVIGLISGTSVDGIDAALVEINQSEQSIQSIKLNFITGKTFPYDRQLRDEILAVCAGEPRSIAQICNLDDAIANAFAQVANQIIDVTQIKPDLIASHGQTVFHRPPIESTLGYSVQLGRGAVIAKTTGIMTVSDFRTADIEAGGQGAPMVSMLDRLFLSQQGKHTVVQNIGGISNLTYLPASGDQVFGFDNAPGNVLIDMASSKLFGVDFDRNGELAAKGNADLSLIKVWLAQDFFLMPPPKSTGRELFCPSYLEQILSQCKHLSNHDILATLTEFTAKAIAQSYRLFLPDFPDRVLICGGGYRNAYLVKRLKALLAPALVMSTDQVGINSDFKEAIAFAVLGYLTFHGQCGNLPQVTGAKEPKVLGKIHLA
ncbi:molecular chaperone [Synechococcus sp. PCC 7502]|uniref:anhydro-N-acetylmuramic acid kinase n=1 Tax=Synechococcus sp. PCC 7502 TaxID=1173263 RepID=UPI00029FFE55|nr:anhydro-N-acetylmuramic acid kinase [Synechococcus sp. PCC 7502]AFY72391.1 molecular chaperone [Synechococcus sp. PCC 7502]